ncbi:MAG TPA: sulfotransferase [Chthoniobacterales bacterium]|nr:sulfotransferase [Chthoniobacterales bacterium]
MLILGGEAALFNIVRGAADPPQKMSSTQKLAFDERACFIAGAAKSGTTLLVSLLDSHPELLVMPQDTAYFPTVLTKYRDRGRRAQFDYLTKESWTNVLFGFQAMRGRQDYAEFPKKKFLETFERVAFDPSNASRDLLVVMMEAYAEVVGVPLERVKRWVEKTPANRNYVPEIFNRFPKAKLLLTMRDPRALLAAQIALEHTRKTRRFSVYYVVAHWQTAANLAKKIRNREIPGLVIGYENLALDPKISMQKVCDYLEINFDPDIVLSPTKVGRPWAGNSAVGDRFAEVSATPVRRWENDLHEGEIGWVEWHCRDLMAEFGYEPRLNQRSLRYFVKPIRGERPKEFLKSRAYSLRDRFTR